MKLFSRREKPRHPQEPTPEPKSAFTVQVSLLVDMAIEAWRIADRTKKLKAAEKTQVQAIEFSIEKIHHILKEMGIEIKDLAGEIYHEGMGLDVLTFDYSPSESPENRIIQETVSPAVYYNGKLIKMAKVIVGSTGGRNPNAQNHD